MAGPLDGIRVLELAGLGPAPFAGMLLADFGASVLRLNRPGAVPLADGGHRVLRRGRCAVAFDLKAAGATDRMAALVGAADVLLDPYRPGVLERLGFGPDECLARNPRLVYARMTGWGQDGPLAQRAGHDINYLGLTGALAAIGEPGRKPVVPLNLVADFGGGGMFLVTGILTALMERNRSGLGQVVDAAMIDGVSVLLAMAHGMRAAGEWRDERGANLLDGGAPFYDTYRCADGRYVAVGALEPQFFTALVETLGLPDAPRQDDHGSWPELRRQLTEAFASRSREEWTELFAGVDACVSPVLELGEAPEHPQLRARNTLVPAAHGFEPAPAPRLSRTPGRFAEPPPVAELLTAWGLPPAVVAELSAP